MKQDMNMDLGIESFLEPDSDFIEELCEHLEGEGIHLTSELLVQILSKYEDHKRQSSGRTIRSKCNQCI